MIFRYKRINIVTIFVAYFLIIEFNNYSENFIKNSGFEEENKLLPLYWSLFVQPQEGSFGKIDKKIFYSGKKSIMLNNAYPYQKEPINNWSQKVSINGLDKKDIYFEGWIKTEKVYKAYFLIQFWKQAPAYIIDSKKTEVLIETNDWKKLTTNITIPEGTDFIVVRCVIEGMGSAWFDDVVLNYEEKRNGDEVTIKTVKENQNIEEGIKKIEQRLEDLLKENAQLKDKINLLEEENKKIREELENKYIKRIEKNIIEDNKKEGTIQDDEKPPILVPHKKNWRMIKKEQE